MTLIVIGVFGAVLWVGAISPLGFRRFSVFDADRRIEFRQAGTFVVFEELPGASRPSFPPPVDVTVRGEGSAPVRVDRLVDPGHLAAPDGYRDAFGHEGRAIARFTITEPGTYRVRVTPKPLGTYDPSEYATRTRATIALGRDLATTWLATPWGVVALVVTPVVAGLVLVVLTRRARRRARSASADSQGPHGDAVSTLDALRSGRAAVGTTHGRS